MYTSLRRQDRKLSMQSLRSAVPELYVTCVRWAVTAGVLTYIASTLSVMAELGVENFWHRQEFLTLRVCVSALAVERRGRPTLAVVMVLIAVAAEFFVTFAESGMASAALPGVPVLVLVAGLFIGVRAAYGIAGFFTVGVPLAVLAGARLGIGAGLDLGDGLYVTAVGIVAFCTVVLLQVFLRSFGEVLTRAESNEQRAADLVASSPDGILVVAPNGRIEMQNERAKELLGEDVRTLLDEHLDQLFRLGADTEPEPRASWSDVGSPRRSPGLVPMTCRGPGTWR